MGKAVVGYRVMAGYLCGVHEDRYEYVVRQIIYNSVAATGPVR
jgi:hypothetical protein